MKIKHSELETCRKDPAGWLAKTGGFARGGYASDIKLAISHFHKTDSHKSAQDKLEEYLKKRVNAQKKQWARDTLDNYVVAFGKSDWLVADTKLRLSLELGPGFILSGEMSRIDVNPKTGQYQAVLISAIIDNNWKSELRWPLLQLAVSQKYSRGIEQVAVGIQTLDGSAIETKCFSNSKIELSVKEAAGLATTIKSLSAKH